MPHEHVLAAADIHHGYRRQGSSVPVLDGVTVGVHRGEMVGIAGPSGVGKSTLARILALVEAPQQGSIWLNGERIRAAGLAVPAETRRRVQLVWQAPRSAVDPRQRLARVVGEPLRYTAAGRTGEHDHRISSVTESVGLTTDLLSRRAREVSDGQLQRACIARALLTSPAVIIADEPGAMLDLSTQAQVLTTLRDQVDRGMTLVLISHDRILLRHWCDRVFDLRDRTLRPVSLSG